MKKFIVFLLAVMSISSVQAVSYKGYVETSGGTVIPSVGDVGFSCGFATSHGVQIIDGLFVGMGVDLQLGMISDSEEDYYGDADVETKVLITGFAEARYNFLRTSKISPFVGLRFGGGWDDNADFPCLYSSPAVGCTFNFTKKFGLDVSLGYSLYSVLGDDYYFEYESGNEYSHIVALRLGIHF